MLPIGSEIVWPEKPQTITEPENSPFKGQTLNSSYYRGQRVHGSARKRPA